MNNSYTGDLKIDGSGSAPGGTYDTVRINGLGKINGDVICRMFRINGTGTVVGNLDTEDGKINGTGTIEGSVRATKFKMIGSSHIRGGITGENLHITGSATFGQTVDVQHIRLEGIAKISADVKADTFHSDGSFELQGLLNADDINIALYHAKSKAGEIGCGKINVSLATSGFNILKSIFTLGLYNPILEVDTIEGDDICLEYTAAKVVRGTNVTIGRGCIIDLVEYKGMYLKNGDAQVREEKKV
jgi:cytoskeletal protein CcmA (bactofilin family)